MKNPNFPASNAVKQGCVLAPTPFCMMFSAMLTDAYTENDPGVSISYCTDGKLFNPQRFNAVTKVKTTTIQQGSHGSWKVLELEKKIGVLESCCQRGKVLEIKTMEGLFSWTTFDGVISCRLHPSQSIAVAMAVFQFAICVLPKPLYSGLDG